MFEYACWKKRKKLETEAMFLPSRETMQIWIEENKKASLSSIFLPITDPDAPKINLPLKNMKIILKRCYDKSIYTKDIISDFSFISFTKGFRYLGFILSYDLADYADIIFRIKQVKLWELLKSSGIQIM